jgi:hypothetical protein
MTGPADVTATFSSANGPLATLTVSMSGDGAGTVRTNNNQCQNYDPLQNTVCTTTYMLGSTANLEPEPAAGSRFSGYIGSGDSPAAAPRLVRLHAEWQHDGDRDVSRAHLDRGVAVDGVEAGRRDADLRRQRLSATASPKRCRSTARGLRRPR